MWLTALWPVVVALFAAIAALTMYGITKLVMTQFPETSMVVILVAGAVGGTLLGVLNGLLTARLGLAAIEVTRPLPFAALPPPALNDLAGELLRPRKDDLPEGRS